jgi:hypothetical protein
LQEGGEKKRKKIEKRRLRRNKRKTKQKEKGGGKPSPKTSNFVFLKCVFLSHTFSQKRM